jgi:SRSO17 transposase
MLPACRTESDGFTMPQLELSSREVEDFVQQLQSFQEVFHDCFTRPEPRDHFFRSMVGQFSDLDRKSIEPMALEVEGGNVRAMQRLISDAVWDAEQMRWTSHHLVKADLGDPRGVVIFDETGFPKKGKDSVGVARQYCGSLGKVEHCQVGGFAAYAAPRGYALLDKRLFWPEAWFTDAYAARRVTCTVPPELSLHTKPQ